jgi:hypothetical protein
VGFLQALQDLNIVLVPYTGASQTGGVVAIWIKKD